MDLGNLDLEIQKAQAAFKKETLNELQKIRERLADIEITRNRGGHVSVIEASATTLLLPGDTVNIKPVVSDRSLASQGPAG